LLRDCAPAGDEREQGSRNHEGGDQAEEHRLAQANSAEAWESRAGPREPGRAAIGKPALGRSPRLWKASAPLGPGRPHAALLVSLRHALDLIPEPHAFLLGPQK